MTKEERQSLIQLLTNFLGYDVTGDLMLEDEINRLLGAVKYECGCNTADREENESERDWFKRWMCMYHWMQTDYYRGKLKEEIDDNTHPDIR